MQTCSSGCFHILAHYKEMDESSLQTKTVKKITDAMKAASAYTIRTLRHANGEEVAMSTSPAEAARRNLRHIAASFLVIQKYAWNGTKTIGGKCNKQLMDENSFDSIVAHTPVMGHVLPPLLQTNRTVKKWSSVLMKIGAGNIDLDVTKQVDWRKIMKALEESQNIGLEELQDIGLPELALLTNAAMGVRAIRKDPDVESAQKQNIPTINEAVSDPTVPGGVVDEQGTEMAGSGGETYYKIDGLNH